MQTLAPLTDLISIHDLPSETVQDIFSRADDLLANPQPNLLKGKIIANCFFEPSTRTRLSFETAAYRLGANVIGFSSDENLSTRKGESLTDTMRVIGGSYADLIVIRHPREGAARLAADLVDVPVINAGDGANQHPTQALIDWYTIRQCQHRTQDLSIALVGDLKYGRVVHSFCELACQFNARLFLVAPPELMLSDDVLNVLKHRGIRFSLHQEIAEIIGKIDILFMTRVQAERFSHHKMNIQPFILTRELLIHAKPNLRILHPLPKVGEIANDVDDCEQAYYFKQAQNGVIVRQALLSMML